MSHFSKDSNHKYIPILNRELKFRYILGVLLLKLVKDFLIVHAYQCILIKRVEFNRKSKKSAFHVKKPSKLLVSKYYY